MKKLSRQLSERILKECQWSERNGGVKDYYKYGDRITFLVGFDVQHILQEATSDEVRAEVRWLINTFDRPKGGMAITAGNGIVSGTPIENILAFLDEAVNYGAEHRQKFNLQ